VILLCDVGGGMRNEVADDVSSGLGGDAAEEEG